MVVFVDLDHDTFSGDQFSLGPDALPHLFAEPAKLTMSKLTVVGAPQSAKLPSDDDTSTDPARDASQFRLEEQNQNQNAFSVALSCYPIVKEIARSVDLNTLHALSRTCRQFHANLAPYRHQLVKQTLRCENEYIETLSDLLRSGTPIPDSVKSVIRLLSQEARSSGRLTAGKVAKCARDMVGECRRCSKVVCRNCTAKPPTSSMLRNRIRRLCATCQTAPLADLLALSPPSLSAYDTQPLSSEQPSFTTEAFQRTPCSCADSVWLCHQCGMFVRNSDTTYRRVWTWRTRYSTYLGGLGTGIGEGCQGVKCGRGETCLAAQEIELEVECEADGSSGSPHGTGYGSVGSHNHPNDRQDSREEEVPGYFRQEIIGIGGVVKHKAKKRVMVGACVVEHEDERETGQYLVREEAGQHRSWCGWCWRVIPCKSDLQK
ncbi:hypothetical protein BDV36DRAFT_258374 [Aspergillus pseudocaelatus]|uniref:F-box domain-containing protein n=1 Tax=Aspergillus pseudocaelatus TaxID=1825620 RepID=A0ABQ6WIL7_9EURO|nr:hypothetical protein BDV36DRAFT_258374 [Aspergillus pseudocaelatus]